MCLASTFHTASRRAGYDSGSEDGRKEGQAVDLLNVDQNLSFYSKVIISGITRPRISNISRAEIWC